MTWVSRDDGGVGAYRQEPSSSFASTIVEAIARQSVGRIVTGCLAAVAVFVIGDFLTGNDISFTAFYLLPVLVAASRDHRSGIRIAIATAGAWFLADVLGRDADHATLLVPVWNASVRFLVFWLVVTLASALTRSLAMEQELSRRDLLSGLPNSRAFHEVADLELRRLQRSGRPLTVAYVDVDQFKRINDRFGHAEGDKVIAMIGAAMVDSIRAVDAVARLGGDEFAILLPETARADAEIVLRRIHSRLTFEAAARTWPIGFSIGAVTFDRAPGSVDELIGAADHVMYDVKNHGRQSVRCVAAPAVAA